MSVLLDLPNELFFNIVIEWLDPTLFLAFTHLDNAVRFNSNLRLLLLNHYTANCCNLPLRFKWLGGYYLQELPREIHNMIKYLPSFPGIRFVIKRVNLNTESRYMGKEDYTFVECLLNSCIMRELSLQTDKVLKETYNYGLSFLKVLHINYNDEATLTGCLCIKNSCFKLEKLIAGSPKDYAEVAVRQVLNEIVANNHNLEYLTVFTTNDIFNILPVNCKQLREVELFLTKSVEVKSIYDVIRALPLLMKFNSQSTFLCEWKNGLYTSQYCYDEQSNQCISINKKETSLKWSLAGRNETLLNDIAKYFASQTTSIHIDPYNKYSDAQTLKRTLLECYNLTALDIYSNVSNNDLIDILQPVAASLQKLTAFNCSVSTIIEVLKYCQNLTIADFCGVQHDSKEHPQAIKDLKKILSQYPIKSLHAFLSFGPHSNDRLWYTAGEFTDRMDYYTWK